MKNPRDEFHQMLREIPTYSSWKAGELASVFIRYREIVVQMVESDDYRNFRWLDDYCPDLGGRLQQMMSETETDKQSRQFDNIVFELQSAIEVIAAGTLMCNNQVERNTMVVRVLPKVA